MALTQKQRDDRRHEKAVKHQEEELRLKVRPGTKQALLELMQWSGIEDRQRGLAFGYFSTPLGCKFDTEFSGFLEGRPVSGLLD